MAAKNYLVPINGNKNELQNWLFQNLGSAPGTPVAGQFYYDTGSNQFLYYNGTAFVNKATDSALFNGNNAAYYLARANHTGSQLSATISDLAATVQAYPLSSFAVPTGNVAFGGFKITGLGNPTAGTDAANKSYVDGKVAGLSWKDEVQAATQANAPIATGLVNGTVIDGYTLQTGDRVLVRANTTASENGIYDVPASGAATRSADSTTGAQIDGAAVFVQNGTLSGGTRYVCNTTGTITVGTTALSFVVFGAGSTYTNGNGISLTGNVFAFLPKVGGGLLVDGTGAYVDTSLVTMKYSVNVGDGSATSIVITHNLNTRDVMTRVYLNSGTYAEVECDVQHTTVNTITLIFTVAPTAAQYRVVVQG